MYAKTARWRGWSFVSYWERRRKTLALLKNRDAAVTLLGKFTLQREDVVELHAQLAIMAWKTYGLL